MIFAVYQLDMLPTAPSYKSVKLMINQPDQGTHISVYFTKVMQLSSVV